MKTKTVFLVGISILGIVLLTHVLAHREPRVPVAGAEPVELLRQHRTDPSQPNPVVFDNKLAALTAKVEQLRAELAAQPTTAPAVPMGPAPVQKPPVDQQAERDEYLANIEAAFNAERRDPKWAADTASKLQQTVESEPVLRAALRSLECRSQSCRVELDDDGTAEFSRQFTLFVHHTGAVLQRVEFDHVDLGDGKRAHVLYMSADATQAEEGVSSAL